MVIAVDRQQKRSEGMVAVLDESIFGAVKWVELICVLCWRLMLLLLVVVSSVL